MHFPAAIHRDAGSVYGVIVPDIPGVHSSDNKIEVM